MESNANGDICGTGAGCAESEGAAGLLVVCHSNKQS